MIPVMPAKRRPAASWPAELKEKAKDKEPKKAAAPAKKGFSDLGF